MSKIRTTVDSYVQTLEPSVINVFASSNDATGMIVRSRRRLRYGADKTGGEMPVRKESDEQTMHDVIQVLLVDDHALVRRGLRTILESYGNVQVVAEVGDGRQAIEAVRTLRPQLVVMDINMPVMDGITATACIKQAFPDTIVVGLSVNASNENREAVIKAGASELIAKEAALEHLHDAIVRALKVSKVERRLCSAIGDSA